MIFVSKRVTHQITLALCTLLLIMLLTACSGIPGVGSSSTPTPAAGSTPQATPTPAVTFLTYTDSNFTINYPKDWPPKPSNGTVVFSDSLGIYNFTVGTAPNTGGLLTSDQLADAGINAAKGSLTNAQTVTVAPTMTVGGQSWSQRAISGTTTQNGQTVEVELVELAISYPPQSTTSKGYVIAYGTLKATFSVAAAAYFTPMLQSFKFPA